MKLGRIQRREVRFHDQSLFLRNNEEHNGRRRRFDWESGQINDAQAKSAIVKWLKSGGKGSGGPRSRDTPSHVRLYFLVRIGTRVPPRRISWRERTVLPLSRRKFVTVITSPGN